MKLFIAMTISAFLFYDSIAFAKRSPFVGYFEEDQEVAMKFYAKKECLKNKGQYRNSMCWLKVQDSVEIKETAPEKFDVKIVTYGNHGHDCAFGGEAKLLDPKTLVASHEKCEVTIKLLSKKTISATPSPEADCPCGINVSLDIIKAKKIR
jgi:hypothetical protein